MEKKNFEIEVGGKKIEVEFNDLALHTNGSALVKQDETVILSVVVEGAKKNSNYFPLTVDFEERFYASGLILGNQYTRREMKQSDEAILSGRMVDRTIRPLFDARLRNETQLTLTTLSLSEGDHNPLSILAASLSIATSDIPWNGPVSAVRLIKKNKNSDFIINPSYKEIEEGKNYFNLLCAGKDSEVNMLEFEGFEVEEVEILEGIARACEIIKKLNDFQKKIIEEIGKKKSEPKIKELGNDARDIYEKDFASKISEAYLDNKNKNALSELKNSWLKKLAEELPSAKEDGSLEAADNYFEEKLNDVAHNLAKEGKRYDGRKLDEIRPLFVKAGGISNKLHGSGFFYRGETHIFSVLTLGELDKEITNESARGDKNKNFFHHYNFPPFSSGETGKNAGPNRRAIGHGKLVEKSLRPTIPNLEDFPYTIRLVSESLSSNGSTSMGSVCASTVALMDGGVPIKNIVGGISIGLFKGSDGEDILLTDIGGPEDHYGDMDFKIAGTENGVNAMQLDIKIDSLNQEIIEQALEEGRKARLKIIEKIKSEIPNRREEINVAIPLSKVIHINKEKIGLLIGPNGHNVKRIREETGADINIENSGRVYISVERNKDDKERLEKTILIIERLLSGA